MNAITNDILDVAQYQRHYQFTTPENVLSASGHVARLNELLSQERYALRRQEQRKSRLVAEALDAIEALGAEPIHLPVARTYDSDIGSYWIVEEGLYAGGIQHQMRYTRRRFAYPAEVTQSVFIGEMPAWVADRYEQALGVFPENHLWVASRNATLFATQTRKYVAPRACPLLVGVDWNGTQWLLAAWGLEHELEGMA